MRGALTGYTRSVPRGEPKVMFTVRLPGHLVEQLIEKAREEDVSRADLVERALEQYLEGPHGDRR
jgi:metal-responsive CopG/Arc/MetJ family transcriptional regulator